MISVAVKCPIACSLWCFIYLAFFTGTQQCEDGWTAYNGHCYFLNSDAMSWHSARSWCMERGADLASILSQDEQNFTLNLAEQNFYSGNLWIGLNQLSDMSTLEWSDGSKIEYTNWVSGHPLNDQLNLCTNTLSLYQLSFTRYANTNMMRGVVNCPTCADDDDDDNTFYLGYIYTTYPDACEALCAAQQRCRIYVFYSLYYPLRLWEGHCLGATNETGINANEPDVTSGVRDSSPVLEVVPTWQTTNCGATSGSICKKPEQSSGPITTVPPSLVEGYCPAGYYGIGNKCLKLVRSNEALVNWTEALAICRSQPGLFSDLASISSQEEQDLLISMFRDFEVGVWIGFTLQSDGDWVWVDNSHVGYTHWAAGEPNLVEEKCAEMVTWSYSSLYSGEWNNIECNNLRGYVCQTYKDASAPITTPPPTLMSCPFGYVAYWNACYRFVTTQVTWSEADQLCRNDGAYLTSILNEPEDTALYLYGSKQEQLPLWIGLHKISYDKFGWANGWPVIYTNWMSGEPSSADECVIMTPSGQWDAISCANTSGYICKFAEEVSLTTVEDIDGTCPPNWVGWGSDCYGFPSSSKDTVETWNDGMIKCQQLAGDSYNATLASIHSDAEDMFIFNTFLQRLLISSIFATAKIGFKQDIAYGPYYWADGTEFRYTHWAPGEPNYNYNRQCGQMYLGVNYGYWNDIDCDCYCTSLYVCKTPKAIGTTASYTTMQNEMAMKVEDKIGGN